jgi:hypothetical protein
MYSSDRVIMITILIMIYYGSDRTQFDVTRETLLEEVLETYPIPVVNGLPVLEKCLRWQGCELFIMGGLAALQIGPTARNLSGALMACEKIVPTLTSPLTRSLP